MKRGIKIDWNDSNLTGMVAPPCEVIPPFNDIPALEYPEVLDEKSLCIMELHMSNGWRLKSDFVRLIKEVRRLNGKK